MRKYMAVLLLLSACSASESSTEEPGSALSLKLDVIEFRLDRLEKAHLRAEKERNTLATLKTAEGESDAEKSARLKLDDVKDEEMALRFAPPSNAELAEWRKKRSEKSGMP